MEQSWDGEIETEETDINIIGLKIDLSSILESSAARSPVCGKPRAAVRAIAVRR